MTTLIRYPFPLRHDFVAVLNAPDDLTAEEAERICAWVRTLPVDALPRPVTSTPPAPGGTPTP